MAVQARTKAQLLSVVVDIFKTIMEARYVSSCQIISPASITLAMRLGSRIWVCALALLPHSRADQGTTSTSAGKPITTWIAQREFPKAIFSSYYKEPSADQQVSDLRSLLLASPTKSQSHNRSSTMIFTIIRSLLNLLTHSTSTQSCPIRSIFHQTILLRGIQTLPKHSISLLIWLRRLSMDPLALRVTVQDV